MSTTFRLIPSVDVSKKETVHAGEFATWLDETNRGADADVPCGTCAACCKSSYFILVAPSDTAALAAIPSELLFPAPGLEPGHLLMGFNEEGHCPMLVDDACTIYAQRPKTCRTYDCRVFAAVSIDAGGVEKVGVNERAARWGFEFSDDQARLLVSAAAAIAALIKEQGDSFPAGLRQNPSPLALFALEHAPALVEAVRDADAPMTNAQVVEWLSAKVRRA